ncbi:MAG TPA: hypothetical protein VGG84_12760 [Gemmatimonadaceae bacterium]
MTHSRHLCFIGLAAALSAVAMPLDRAVAQRPDTTRAPAPVVVDTVSRPIPQAPLSPRRAFLYSALLPGYAQSVLRRPSAAALFVLTESIGIAMLRESKSELNEARRLRTDSLVPVGLDPITGVPVFQASSFNDGLINTRRRNVEDWVAFLIANHLFAAADGFVAAHLWDLPIQVSARRTESATVIAARVRW